MCMDIGDFPVSNDVQLTRIEGKIDLINERQGRMDADISDVRQRLNGHSNRLNVLETADTMAAGERKGTQQVVKVLWAILAVLLTGGLATIATVVAALSGAFNGG